MWGRISAEEIAQSLGGRKSGSGWIACCPAHEDRTASLSLGEAPDGKLLLNCFGPCSNAAVIDALRAHPGRS